MRLVDEALSARQVRWLTGQAALVVSTRYHPVVFGLAAGVPSGPVSRVPRRWPTTTRSC
jgi:polysaccharide pyruvyl transferase WcaK-like protein